MFHKVRRFRQATADFQAISLTIFLLIKVLNASFRPKAVIPADC